jgi:predicted N-formylglutamate amidohydrolase
MKFLIVADHAGNSMPRTLGRLGLSETECEHHVAWDIGIAAVSRLMADALDATHRHHDFLEFPNGEVELLTLLAVNQRATVLQLPAAPRTEAEREDQRRAEYAG